MSQVLYRKYRPTKFADVTGQDHIVATLVNALKSGRTAHAYLFSGPRGTGKTSVARILAKAVNCLNPESGEPDLTCANCLAIAEQSALDLTEIDAASHTQVDKMRDLLEKVRLAPTDLATKVYIIDEVHMLSAASFNALLKTLEEPPENTLFVLATTEIHKVPATVISRTQRFDFRRIASRDLTLELAKIAKAEQIEIDKAALELIAAAAEGGFRDALSLLDQLRAYSNDKISLEAAEAVLGVTDLSALETFTEHTIAGRAKEAVMLLNSLIEEGYDLAQFAKSEIEYLRKLLVLKLSGEPDHDLSPERAERMGELAAMVSEKELTNILELVIAAGKEAKFSPLPQLPYELAVVRVAYGAGTPVRTPIELAAPDRQTLKIKPAEAVTPPPATEAKQPPADTPVIERERPKPAPVRAEAVAGSIEIELWNQLLAAVRAGASSLAASLELSEPRLTGNILELTFEYKFHKERIDERKNRVVIEQAAETIIGTPVTIRTVLKERIMPTSVAQIETAKREDLLASALEVLGGEIVGEEGI